MRTGPTYLHGDVAIWLRKRLESLFPGWRVETFHTSHVRMSCFLRETRLSGTFPVLEALGVVADVTGVMRRDGKVELVFVTCRTSPIHLKDIGPVLACSVIASPALSVVVSPFGISPSLDLLLNRYNRVDLLEYASNKRIKIGTWDSVRKQVDPGTVIPPGGLG